MRQAFLTVDLGFGDAGKGSIVDFLTRTYAAHTVVRYNGGAQAGHRVVAVDHLGLQQEHVFAQFGSGTLAGANTHLSRFMLLEPLGMLEEEKHLRKLGVVDAFQRTTINQQARVITPFQRAANRLQELARGNQRHGSCGLGVGETMADALAHGAQALCAGDLAKPDILYAKLSNLRAINIAKVAALRNSVAVNQQIDAEWAWLTDPDWADWLIPAYRDFADQAHIVPANYLNMILQQTGNVIFEGAQGVLLDEWAGFHPYTTWSTTTLTNAHMLLAEANYSGQLTRIGITRAYATRHGAGPFVSETAELSQALTDACNTFGAWQQGFRVGWLDLVMLRYALEIVGPLDYLAVTCLDRLTALQAQLPALQICRRYTCGANSLDRLVPAPQAQDLAYQAELTCDLARCRPQLEEVENVAALLDLLSETLGVPIGLVSTGPTAKDKQLLAEISTLA